MSAKLDVKFRRVELDPISYSYKNKLRIVRRQCEARNYKTDRLGSPRSSLAFKVEPDKLFELQIATADSPIVPEGS